MRSVRSLSIVTLVAAASLSLPSSADAATVGPGAGQPSPVVGALAPLIPAAAGSAVPGSYIVTMRSGADVTTAATTSAFDAAAPGAVVAGSTYTAKLDDSQLAAVRRNPQVAAVEADQVYRATTVQTPPSGGWGIDRIDQRRLPLNGTYSYTSAAANVTAYIVDSGIQVNHPQFGGRAAVAYDAFGASGNDCNGHGTHVAGIVGGSSYGVAKAVKLRGVRVLDCNGSGTTSGVIAGLNWIRTHRSGPAVANLSLAGPKSAALDAAVKSLYDSGVAVAVAAGNEAKDSCTQSPAGATGVLTVGAVDKTDRHASFSNFGPCVELYAPGVNVTSAWIGSSTSTLSGTSMASPFVAGVLALRMANGTSAASARTWVINQATAGIVVGEPTGTHDRMLYKESL